MLTHSFAVKLEKQVYMCEVRARAFGLSSFIWGNKDDFQEASRPADLVFTLGFLFLFLFLSLTLWQGTSV